jgi:folate-binding protein YgfZ
MTETEAVFADRSERGKLRFTGPQRAWFLHQVLTQATEDMRPGEARDAAMLTVHGRMVGYLELLAAEDAFLAHFEAELSHTLPEAIGRYVFASQVDIVDVTGEMGLILVAGPEWERAAEGSGALLHPSRALGVPAGYLWLGRSEVDTVIAGLRSRGLRAASEPQLESLRISHGVPRWGREMSAKTLPQEAGIDEVAVHYDKGCYLGQEAMAKIHFRGKVNRRLRRLAVAGDLEAGSDVVAGDQKVGTVTSVADGSALALLRHTVEPGAEVVAGSATATVLA